MNTDKLNEYRVFHLSAQTFLPLVETMHTNAYEELVADYRAGKENLLPKVARCAALHELKEEIITKAKLYEKYAEDK